MGDDTVDHLALHQQGYPGADRNGSSQGKTEAARRHVRDGDSESGSAAAIVAEFQRADDLDREPAMVSRFSGHMEGIGVSPSDGMGNWP